MAAKMWFWLCVAFSERRQAYRVMMMHGVALLDWMKDHYLHEKLTTWSTQSKEGNTISSMHGVHCSLHSMSVAVDACSKHMK